jgi:NAD(P)-dependent dehydrogenase (short-subunit alcohol dehydrogenase family)
MGGVVDSFRLDDRVALVANAADGVGREVAKALAEAGAIVAEVDLAGQAETSTGAEAVVQRVLERYGQLDILVNNVTAVPAPSSGTVTSDAWREVMADTVDTPYFLTHAVGLHMIQRGQGGRILNVAPSLARPHSEPSTLAEDTANGAIANFTRALATMLAPHGILVNCIWADTTAPPLDSARRHGIEDVKGLAVFLTSPASAYITGQIIAVNVGALR